MTVPTTVPVSDVIFALQKAFIPVTPVAKPAPSIPVMIYAIITSPCIALCWTNLLMYVPAVRRRKPANETMPTILHTGLTPTMSNNVAPPEKESVPVPNVSWNSMIY